MYVEGLIGYDELQRIEILENEQVPEVRQRARLASFTFLGVRSLGAPVSRISSLAFFELP